MNAAFRRRAAEAASLKAPFRSFAFAAVETAAASFGRRRATCGIPAGVAAPPRRTTFVPPPSRLDAAPVLVVETDGASAATATAMATTTKTARSPSTSFARAAACSSGRSFFSSSAAARVQSADYDDGEEAPAASAVADHFSVLGFPPAYGIDPSELKSAYRRLMAKLHPDRHSFAAPEERERLSHDAAAVTRAHDVLKDDMLRAEHLLEMKGMGLHERDGVELVGPELLMDVMEIREDIDDCASEDDPRLKSLLEANRERVASTVEELTAAFKDGDYDEARRSTAKLRYWRRIEESILEKIGMVEE